VSKGGREWEAYGVAVSIEEPIDQDLITMDSNNSIHQPVGISTGIRTHHTLP